MTELTEKFGKADDFEIDFDSELDEKLDELDISESEDNE